MGEPVSKTHPIPLSTVVVVPVISLDDTVKNTTSFHHPTAVPICSVNSRQGIKCVTVSAITMNVSGMEETVHCTDYGHGKTAPPVCRVGISLRMENVMRNVTMLHASLIVLNARTPHQHPASM